MRAGGWLGIALAWVTLILARCGLEDVLVLNPPGYYNTENPLAPAGGDEFWIQVTGDNNEAELRGLEFFYKIYPESGTPESALATYGDLVSRGFRRLSSETDRTTVIVRPLLFLEVGERGKLSTIKVRLNPDPTGLNPEGDLGLADIIAGPPPDPLPVGALEIPAPGLPIRRGVPDPENNNTYKKFDDFTIGDADVSALSGLTPDSDVIVRMAMYALCFGKKDIATDVYSRAVYLSSVDLQIHVAAP